MVMTFDPARIEALKSSKPIPSNTLSYDASVARDDVEVEIAGDFISVEYYPGTIPFYIRLNELNNEKLNLAKLRYIHYPFYRLFISNIAGNGSIILRIGKGLKLESREYGIEELAARIGSIVTFDRRGEIIIADNFEYGIDHCFTNSDGLGASVVADTTYRHRGQYSAKLTAGSDGDRYAEIGRRLSVPVLSKIGIEISWTAHDDMEELFGYIEFYTSVFKVTFGLKYVYATKQTYFLTLGDTWYPIGGPMAAYASPYLFHTFKMVVDISRILDLLDLKYVRYILGPTTLAVAGIPASIDLTDTTEAHMVIRGRITSVAGSNAVCYLDDFIVTQNEP